jgi:hypothetical protein
VTILDIGMHDFSRRNFSETLGTCPAVIYFLLVCWRIILQPSTKNFHLISGY